MITADFTFDTQGRRNSTVSCIAEPETNDLTSSTNSSSQSMGLGEKRIENARNIFTQAMQETFKLLTPAFNAPVAFPGEKGQPVVLNFEDIVKLYFQNEASKQAVKDLEKKLEEEKSRLAEITKQWEGKIKEEKDKFSQFESQQKAKDEKTKETNEKLGAVVERLEKEKLALVDQKKGIQATLDVISEGCSSQQKEIANYTEMISTHEKEMNLVKEKVTKAVEREREKWARREIEWNHAKALLHKQLEEEKGFTEEERKKTISERKKASDLTTEFQEKIEKYLTDIEDLQEKLDGFTEPSPKKRRTSSSSMAQVETKRELVNP
jgi:chromosome segregation ATPase